MDASLNQFFAQVDKDQNIYVDRLREVVAIPRYFPFSSSCHHHHNKRQQHTTTAHDSNTAGRGKKKKLYSQ